MSAPRDELAAALKPILPNDWAIIDTSRSVDDIPKTVVQLQQVRISRLPAAPMGKHYIGFVVTISAPEQSIAHAEDRLDEQIDDLIHAFDSLGIGWAGAEKVDLGNKRIAYQIPVNVISSKEN